MITISDYAGCKVPKDGEKARELLSQAIGLDVGLQEFAQAVDFGLAAGKEVVEDGFRGVEGHRSGG